MKQIDNMLLWKALQSGQLKLGVNTWNIVGVDYDTGMLTLGRF
jgi:hypothetical protein